MRTRTTKTNSTKRTTDCPMEGLAISSTMSNSSRRSGSPRVDLPNGCTLGLSHCDIAKVSSKWACLVPGFSPGVFAFLERPLVERPRPDSIFECERTDCTPREV